MNANDHAQEPPPKAGSGSDTEDTETSWIKKAVKNTRKFFASSSLGKIKIVWLFICITIVSVLALMVAYYGRLVIEGLQSFLVSPIVNRLSPALQVTHRLETLPTTIQFYFVIALLITSYLGWRLWLRVLLKIEYQRSDETSLLNRKERYAVYTIRIYSHRLITIAGLSIVAAFGILFGGLYFSLFIAPQMSLYDQLRTLTVVYGNNGEKIEESLQDISSPILGNDTSGEDRVIDRLTSDRTVARVVMLIVVFFLVQVLIRLYQYHLKLATFWESRAVAVELMNTLSKDVHLPFDSLVRAMSPDWVDFKSMPKSPLDITDRAATSLYRARTTTL